MRLSNDLIFRDPMGEKVVMADTTFRIMGASATTQGDHQRSQVLAVETKSMIQSGAQHRRGASIVLRCAKDCDRVGGTRLIMCGVIVNLPVHPEKPSRDGDKTSQQQPTKHTPASQRFPVAIGGFRGHHAICFNERRMRGPFVRRATGNPVGKIPLFIFGLSVSVAG
jgi:hypothetical protein